MLDKKVWISGERKAKEFLVKNGYKILEENYKAKFGELDLIAYKDNTFIFVEVKARSSLKFGMPGEAVTGFKQNKIKKLAQAYLIVKNKYPSNCRFDVIEVLDEKITHIENAF